jgi:hypothetical protein
MRRRIPGEAEALWRAGEPYEAGRVTFTDLQNRYRPAWGAAVLELAYRMSGIASIAEIDQIILIANAPIGHSARWYAARGAFHALRAVTLRLDAAGQHGSTVERVVMLGENVAKVTANAYDDLTAPALIVNLPGGPSRQAGRDLVSFGGFRRNAGWKIASILYEVAGRIGGQTGLDEAWQILSYAQGREYASEEPGEAAN